MTAVKALTVLQPWAWAIIHAGKDIENRSWWRPGIVGQRIAIHAAKRGELFAALPFLEQLGITPPHLDELHLGAIIGTVKVLSGHNSGACVRTNTLAHLHPDGPFSCSRWAVGGATGHGPMMHWRLGEPEPMTALPWRGALGLWDAPSVGSLEAVS